MNWNPVEFILAEMAKNQSDLINEMDGLSFQIAVHIMKVLVLVQPSKSEKEKWLKDCLKSLNELHKLHLKNGKNPIKFSKIKKFRKQVSDHSLVRLTNELKGRLAIDDSKWDESVKIYEKIIESALIESEKKYKDRDFKFTMSWLVKYSN